MIEDQGGAGRFQWLSWFLISPALNLNGLIVYQLNYLLLLPKFACDIKSGGSWSTLKDGSAAYEEKCNPEYFCQNQDTMRWSYVNSEFTLNNWMTSWHMECDTGTYIAAISELYFIGLVIGAQISPWVISLVGMKTPIVWRSFLLAFLNTILLVLPKAAGIEWSQMVLCGCMFLIGIVNFVGTIAGY